MDFNEWNPFWATWFNVMAFLIIVGNSLTIATLLRKKVLQASTVFVCGSVWPLLISWLDARLHCTAVTEGCMAVTEGCTAVTEGKTPVPVCSPKLSPVGRG